MKCWDLFSIKKYIENQNVFCCICWLVGLELIGQVNTVKAMLSWSIYLTAHFLDRLNPISG